MGEIEWRTRPDLPDSATYRGHAEVKQLFALVVVPLSWLGRGKLSGALVEERQGETWIYTLRDGKIATVREYRHKAQALEAAGLRE